MKQRDVPRERLQLRESPELLSPPWLAALYQCATAVTVQGCVSDAELELEVGGSVVVTHVAGFADPLGELIALPAPLVTGQQVRARQRLGGALSAWSVPVTVRDHREDLPAGPPRPEINPGPVYKCGCRTGVGDLLAGADVWITADGAEVGRVSGCSTQQGVDVAPDYGLGQRVRAWSELCGDPSPPSIEHVTIAPPAPLPTPGFEPVHAGADQIVVDTIVNGARVTVLRNGVNQGTWGCWGGSLRLGLNPPFSAGDVFSATQSMCPREPASQPGTVTVEPCSALPAPRIGPIQAGDDRVTVVQSVAGALIRVFRNLVQVGAGVAPVVFLNQRVALGDTVHVTQDLAGCRGQSAGEVTVPCVDPPITTDPSALALFPVGHEEYSDGPVRGSVYYPADDDGAGAPFNERLAALGRVPVVVMAHGNHSPADPSYLGYDYFQAELARMGIVAVSVDCNALNGSGGGVGNIEDRADLILDSVAFFQARDADPASRFFGRLDFARLGLMGHSRGGNAVVTIPTVIGLPGVTIRGVLALAPTNFRFWAGLPTIRPDRYAFMTILPAGDGDVVDNNGAQFYDQARPSPFKSQLYVHHTNHNFFNRQWLFDDGAGPPVMARADHERVLSTYGCAFFRNVCLGHGTTPFLSGIQRPAGVASDQVHLSFEKARQTTVDNHEDSSTIAVNSLGLPTTQSGGMSADEFTFGQAPGAFNGTFYGQSIGMVARPGPSTRELRSPVSANLQRREIWIRAAEVADERMPEAGTGFELGVEDVHGLVAWVDSDLVGGLPRPYPNPFSLKSMLKTLRVKAEYFRARQPKLDLARIAAIHIRCNRPDERALAFDDLQLVKP